MYDYAYSSMAHDAYNDAMAEHNEDAYWDAYWDEFWDNYDPEAEIGYLREEYRRIGERIAKEANLTTDTVKMRQAQKLEELESIREPQERGFIHRDPAFQFVKKAFGGAYSRSEKVELWRSSETTFAHRKAIEQVACLATVAADLGVNPF